MAIENKTEHIRRSWAYRATRVIAFVMDRCLLDPILGFVPWLDSAVGLVCTAFYIYVAARQVRSLPLTLAFVYNYLCDTVVGLIPYVGDVLDFFNRSYIQNQRLLDGFIDGDEAIIRRVNGKARTLIVLCILCLLLIIALAWLTIYLAASLFELIFSWLS